MSEILVRLMITVAQTKSAIRKLAFVQQDITIPTVMMNVTRVHQGITRLVLGKMLVLKSMLAISQRTGRQQCQHGGSRPRGLCVRVLQQCGSHGVYSGIGWVTSWHGRPRGFFTGVNTAAVDQEACASGYYSSARWSHGRCTQASAGYIATDGQGSVDSRVSTRRQ